MLGVATLNRFRFPGDLSKGGAFTIIELLVAMAVLSVVVVLSTAAISGLSALTQRSTAKATAFQTARTAFGMLEGDLGRATLRSYWDYVDAGGRFLEPANASGFEPSRYARNAGLHFLVGTSGDGVMPGTPGTGQAVCFQLPLGRAAEPGDYRGLPTILNEVGYFVDYRRDASLPPPFPQNTGPYRYRLIRSVVPSEEVSIYATRPGANATDWVASLKLPTNEEILADNVVMLVVWPRKSPATDVEGDELTTDFTYDSRRDVDRDPQPESANQLPPTARIVMVVVSEDVAARFCVSASPPPEIHGIFDGLFQSATEAAFVEDLQTLAERFAAKNIRDYRIFQTTVPLRESRML